MNIKKYKNFFFLLFLTAFVNINYIFFLNVEYMLSYLYYNDKYFSYIIFKWFLPSYTFGIFISGLNVLYFIDLLGYKKTIQISVFCLGLFLIILSFFKNTFVFLIFSVILGYIMALLTVFIHNILYGLYPNKIGLFGGFISGGWVLSFIPVSIILQKIVNPNNLKPNNWVNLDGIDIKLYSKEIANKFDSFIYIYGFIIIILGSIISFFIENPKGIKSNLSFYLNKIFLKKEEKEKYNSNIEIWKNNKTYSYKIDLENSQYSKSIKKIKSIELSDITVSLNSDYEKNIDKIIDNATIRNHLKSKIFLTMFFNFTLIYSIYLYSCLKLKERGIKFYGEVFILKINTFFLFINFLGRVITGILVNFLNLKKLVLLVNFLLIFSTILLFLENPILSYFLSNFLFFFSVGVGVACMRISCRKTFKDNKISTTLQGYMENASLFAAIFEFFLEVVFSQFLNIKVFIIVLLSFNIIFFNKNIN